MAIPVGKSALLYVDGRLDGPGTVTVLPGREWLVYQADDPVPRDCPPGRPNVVRYRTRTGAEFHAFLLAQRTEDTLVVRRDGDVRGEAATLHELGRLDAAGDAGRVAAPSCGGRPPTASLPKSSRSSDFGGARSKNGLSSIRARASSFTFPVRAKAPSSSTGLPLCRCIQSSMGALPGPVSKAITVSPDI